MSNGNPHYRCKRSEVLATRTNLFDGHLEYLLRIETLNTCSRDGHMTLMGPGSDYWKSIWFSEDEVTLIHYDSEANIIEDKKENEPTDV